MGVITLLDTPGFNDSDVNRSDKSILIETIKTIRPMTKDASKGISSLVQCIMPNAAHRITDTTVNANKLILFIFNCLTKPIDISKHPKFLIVFNNVSKYGNNYDPFTVDNSKPKEVLDAIESSKKRAEEFKTQLKEKVKKFLLNTEISDEI